MYEVTRFSPAVYADVSGIPAILEELRRRRLPVKRYLSAYLPTPTARIARQAHLAHFHAECRSIGQKLESAGRGERAALNAAVTRIEEYLDLVSAPRHPGIAVFAAPERGYLAAVPLPDPPETLVVWDTEPVLEPMEGILREQESVGLR